MVDKNDPFMAKLGKGERWAAGSAGTLALIASAGLTIAATIWDKTVNSIGVGSLFAIALVLLVLAVAGRLPASVSATDKGLSVSFASGVAAGAEKATAKAKAQVAEAISQDREELEKRISKAQAPGDVSQVLDDMTERIQNNVVAPSVSELLPAIKQPNA